MDDMLEFWQKESQRYAEAARAHLSRAINGITFGVPLLVGGVAAAAAYKHYELLLAVPLIVTAEWGVVLQAIEEEIFAAAHQQHAEQQMNVVLRTLPPSSLVPPWDDYGGRLSRDGAVLKVTFVLWAFASLVLFVASYIGAATFAHIQSIWLIAAGVVDAAAFLALAVAARRMVTTATTLRNSLQALSTISTHPMP